MVGLFQLIEGNGLTDDERYLLAKELIVDERDFYLAMGYRLAPIWLMPYSDRRGLPVIRVRQALR